VSTFLLEIGTEELPADFARLALPQLEALVRRDLAERRLNHGPVSVTSTPRRIALLVADLAAAAADLEEDRKGPPAAQALKDGVATPAAIGFAKRCGVEASALEVRDTAKGPFVFARVREPGLPAAELLAACIPQWMTGLQGRRFMRWAEGESRFSRPVRWLVALLDGAVIPLTLAGSDPLVSAGRLSRGHRLHGAGAGGGARGDTGVAIATASAYAETLAAAGVEVDRQRRAALIRSAVEAAASALQARPDLPEELFDELTDLVEAPLLIEGSVPEAYLALPAEVLSTVMRAHQRYVPLYRQQAEVDPLALDARSSLLPTFLCIANSLPSATTTVRRGNERVLKARLADAEFFVAADRAVASIDRRDQLARVTFAEGLGSLLNRVERLEWCTDVLVKQLALAEQDAAHARRAAHLSEARPGQPDGGRVPRAAGGDGRQIPAGGRGTPPRGPGGAGALPAPRRRRQPAVLHRRCRGGPGGTPGAVAEYLCQGRAAQRLLRPLCPAPGRQWPAADPLAPGLAPQPSGAVGALLRPLGRAAARLCGGWACLGGGIGDFLRQRLVSLLEEAGLPSDLVQAVAGEAVAIKRVLGDPADARQRAELLVALRANGQLAAVQAVVTRAARLAAKGDLPSDQLSADGVVSEDFFEQPSESAMLAVLQGLEPLAAGSGTERYQALADGLAQGAQALAAFFDGDQSVMVMVDDPAVRRNRLNLLGLLRNQASVLADFDAISG
jgi:glycyl-tRNA synthetase beta chain